jgi:hypothetical protein
MELASRTSLLPRRERRPGLLLSLFLTVSVCAVLVLPFLLSSYADYRFESVALATLLLAVCSYPAVRYYARAETGLPTLPVFCLAYALQFAVPIFTHDDTFLLAGAEVKYLANEDVISALLMAILGILCLQVGFYWFLKSSYRHTIPVARLPLNKRKALLYCIIVGLLLPLLFTFQGLIPDEFQQPLSSILRLLQNQVLVVIGILGWLYFSREGSRIYGLWLYGLVLIASMRGISSGMLEEAIIPIGVLFVVKWLYTRRIPVMPIITTVLIIVILSPVKADYRQQAGQNPELADQSSLVRGTAWIWAAVEYWEDTFTGRWDLVEATSSATSRADFIHQVAHIYSMTPSVIPYQYGGTYSFFIVAMIPRVIWPDKPTAGSANNFYAVSYGVSTEEGVKTTTFGISILGEAFINFGWFGVGLIMLLQGIVIGMLHHAFGSDSSGPGGQAIFLAFFVYFLNGIGSSAEIMFGGILQNLLCGYFLLLWAREKQIKLPFTRLHPAVMAKEVISK